MSLLSPPAHGGAVSTRTFIPHRVHEAIGVLGAVSRRHRVPAARLGGAEVADRQDETDGPIDIEVEHPTGFFTVTMEVGRVDGAVRRDRVGPAAHRPPADARRGLSCRRRSGPAA